MKFSQIGKCLDSIFNQSYPKDSTEVIVVNDFSTDGTETLVSDHKLKCKLIEPFGLRYRKSEFI